MSLIRGSQTLGITGSGGGATGSYVTTSSFNSFTASYSSDSASFVQSIGHLSSSQSTYLGTSSFNSFTASYQTDSASFNNKINIISGSILTGSFATTTSFNAYTSSTSLQISNIYASESNYLNTSSFNNFSSSYFTDSSSFNSKINNAFASESNYTLTSSFNIFTSILNAFTSSAILISSNSFASQSNYLPTSSFNTFSSSYHIDSSSFNTRIITATGSITYTGSLLLTSSFNTFTSSYIVDSASFNIRINSITGSSINTGSLSTTASLNALSSSYSTDSASFNLRINSITGSTYDPTQLNAFSSSILLFTSSLNTIVSNSFASQSNYTFTSSFITVSSSLYTVSSSVYSLSGSYHTDSGSNYTKILNIFASESNYISTGSLSSSIFGGINTIARFSGSHSLTGSMIFQSGSSILIGGNLSGSNPASLQIASGLYVSGSFYDSTNSTGSIGYVLTSIGTGSKWVPSASSAPVLLFANTNVPSGNIIANTNIETPFSSSYTFNSGSLFPGQVVRISMYGVYSTDVIASTIECRIKLGSTIILDSMAFTTIATINNGGWWSECIFIVDATGSSGIVEAQGVAELSTALGAGMNINFPNTASISLNTTGSLPLTATIIWGTASTSNSITLREFIVECLNNGAGSSVTSIGGSGTINGGGVNNYHAVFSGSSAITSSILYQTGSSLLIGNTTGSSNSASLQIYGATYLSGSLYDSINSTGSIGTVLTSNSNGLPVWIGGVILVASGSVSGTTTANIFFSNFNFTKLEVEFYDIIPGTTATDLHMLTSPNGTTFDTGSTAYAYAYGGGNTAGAITNGGSTGNSFIILAGGLTNTAANGVGSATVIIKDPGNITTYKNIQWTSLVGQASGAPALIYGVSQRQSTGSIQGVQFNMSSGNITGKYKVYGYY